jgi:ABC-type polar amino acid transport system ATPase subunit
LLGPSGCGKTTTLRMVAGLEESTGERISIGSRVVNDPAKKVHLPPDRRRLGMVFQSYAIWPHMQVFDNVAYPLRVRRRPEAEIRQRVEKALTLVEMDRFAVAYGDQNFAPGDRVRILVRLEDIRAGVVSDEVDAAWRGEVLNSVFRGARRMRTQAGELRIEVPALTRPVVGDTIDIGAAKSALWAFACP